MYLIKCALADLVAKKILLEKYGSDSSHLIEKIKAATSYHWINEYGSSCLTAPQLTEITVFLKSNFDCTVDNSCANESIDCSNIVITIQEDSVTTTIINISDPDDA